jgi:hypothetical protein
MDIPEFQRQVSLQYVVKFTSALVPLADNHSETELKVSINQWDGYLLEANPLPGTVYGDIIAADPLLCIDTSSISHHTQRLCSSVSEWFSIQPHKQPNCPCGLEAVCYSTGHRRQSWLRDFVAEIVGRNAILCLERVSLAEDDIPDRQ